MSFIITEQKACSFQGKLPCLSGSQRCPEGAAITCLGVICSRHWWCYLAPGLWWPSAQLCGWCCPERTSSEAWCCGFAALCSPGNVTSFKVLSHYKLNTFHISAVLYSHLLTVYSSCCQWPNLHTWTFKASHYVCRYFIIIIFLYYILVFNYYKPSYASSCYMSLLLLLWTVCAEDQQEASELRDLACRITQHSLQIWKQPLALESFHLHNCIFRGWERFNVFHRMSNYSWQISPFITSLKGYKCFTVRKRCRRSGNMAACCCFLQLIYNDNNYSEVVRAQRFMQRLGAPLVINRNSKVKEDFSLK